MINKQFAAAVYYLSNRQSNPARLKNVKFPVFIVSPLEIRQYIGVTKLQKRKIFLFLRSKSFCRSFFCAGKREIGHQALRYWLMNAMPHGKRDERNRTVFDRLLLMVILIEPLCSTVSKAIICVQVQMHQEKAKTGYTIR